MMHLNKQTFLGWPYQKSLLMLLVICAIGLSFSSLIPPFQSPDEFAHVQRAYLLGKGVILLNAPAGRSSGGMVDSGLAEYMSVYDALVNKPDKKLSTKEIDLAKNIKWSGVREFRDRELPGAAYYFPIIYLPQAIGLATGEMFGLTVNTSYQLARFMALVSVAAILVIAFGIYPVSPLTVSLLIMPMSVFQFSSASLDGISTALAVFSTALFFRIMSRPATFSANSFYWLLLAVVILSSGRVYATPLFLLVLFACGHLKQKKYYFAAGAGVVAVLIWLAMAVMTTVNAVYANIVGATTLNLLHYYASNPAALVAVLAHTLSDHDLLMFYRNSFIGILGWIDTPFSNSFYNAYSVLIGLAGLLSVSLKNIQTQWAARMVVLMSAFFSACLIFIALLVTFTQHPATVISGIQGRYFLIPVILFSYAISGDIGIVEGVIRKAALVVLLALGALTIAVMPRLLIERYYVAEQPSNPVTVAIHPSAPLEKDHPIKLFMNAQSGSHQLRRMGILFGTYRKKNVGSANLVLTTIEGRPLIIQFDLSALIDNKYQFFNLAQGVYSSGQISYQTGGGISAWQAHSDNGAIETCLVYEYDNGDMVYTRGCPKAF